MVVFIFIWHVESSVRFSPNNQIVIVHEKDFIIRIFDDVVDCIKLHYFRPETLIVLTTRCLLPRPFILLMFQRFASVCVTGIHF